MVEQEGKTSAVSSSGHPFGALLQVHRSRSLLALFPRPYVLMDGRRITESLRLEETSAIICSNRPPTANATHRAVSPSTASDGFLLTLHPGRF